jgi:hypothetical protein
LSGASIGACGIKDGQGLKVARGECDFPEPFRLRAYEAHSPSCSPIGPDGFHPHGLVKEGPNKKLAFSKNLSGSSSDALLPILHCHPPRWLPAESGLLQRIIDGPIMQRGGAIDNGLLAAEWKQTTEGHVAHACPQWLAVAILLGCR